MTSFSEKVEKIGYHSNFNFECDAESGSKESLSIALGRRCSNFRKSFQLLKLLFAGN